MRGFAVASQSGTLPSSSIALLFQLGVSVALGGRGSGIPPAAARSFRAPLASPLGKLSPPQGGD